ncbi:hypothetical protein JUN65_08015 [Gluconacetobacter azotocaptans]|uniref:hypothetical protein n=1 Tax=Gluconacetobacter azotocaptans TaxID=142834 RepID=UPI00195C656E|nr:hypothetical protein [Gluconacetobacter azotocaptans]MBM9401530.1 hypothetical protein [Gluconacetobacter azotocaptans]
MTHLSRRAILRGATALAGASALGACAVSTNGNVTTITVDVDEVVTDTNVALAVIKTGLGFTGIPAGVVTIINGTIGLIQTGLTSFKATAGSSLSLTFDSTSVPAAFTSLIADIKTAAANIAAVAQSEGDALSSSTAAQVSSISSDVGNIAAILESIIGTAVGARLGAAASAQTGRLIQIDAIKARHGLR